MYNDRYVLHILWILYYVDIMMYDVTKQQLKIGLCQFCSSHFQRLTVESRNLQKMTWSSLVRRRGAI